MSDNGDKKHLLSVIRNIVENTADFQDFMVSVLGKLPMGIFIKDMELDFKYIYWNQFVENFIGVKYPVIKRSDIQKSNCDRLFVGHKRKEEDERVISSGKPLKYHEKIQDISGNLRDIEITKFPVALNNGKTLLVTTWEDITALTAAKKRLEHAGELSKMALHTNDIWTASLIIEPQTKINYDDSIVCLNRWENTEEKIIKIPWNVYLLTIFPEDRELLNYEFRRLCTGELMKHQIEVRIRRPQSEDFCWYEISAFVSEWSKTGKPTVVLASAANIQTRKEQELTLEEAKGKAELADKMKSKYLADMSHEIRTPLTAITGFAELMAFADTDEERLSYYDIIKTNNQMLMQLINDILDLSKIEADVVKIAYEQVDINEVLDTVYASTVLRIHEGVKLYVEKKEKHYMFGADPIRLLQIITNLVNNAIKHTKEGSITIGYTEQEDGQLYFYVRDTGAGISKEKQANLFDRFAKMNDYAEGIGLGLAICQGLVTKMGGTICVTSELGVGSEFSFLLPSHPTNRFED